MFLYIGVFFFFFLPCFLVGAIKSPSSFGWLAGCCVLSALLAYSIMVMAAIS